jgi:hypothetical protein
MMLAMAAPWMISFACGDLTGPFSLPSLTAIRPVVFEILVISVGGAGALLLFVGIRHLARLLFRSRTSKRETSLARMTNPVAATDYLCATTSEFAIALHCDEGPRSHRFEPGVAGELWFSETVSRLRSILPGMQVESPAPSPQRDDAVDLDVSVSFVVDENEDEVGVLCASSVVAEAPPSPTPAHATDDAKGPVGETSRSRAKTLILGGMQRLPDFAGAGVAAPSGAAGNFDAGGFDYGGRRV